MNKTDKRTGGRAASRKQDRTHEEIASYAERLAAISGDIQAVADGMTLLQLTSIPVDGVNKIDRGLRDIEDWADNVDLSYRRAKRQVKN